MVCPPDAIARTASGPLGPASTAILDVISRVSSNSGCLGTRARVSLPASHARLLSRPRDRSFSLFFLLFLSFFFLIPRRAVDTGRPVKVAPPRSIEDRSRGEAISGCSPLGNLPFGKRKENKRRDSSEATR